MHYFNKNIKIVLLFMQISDIIKLTNMEGYYMEKLYKRELYLSKIRPFYKDVDMIKVLTGVRRCGKSSIMQLICNELIENEISKSNIVYINLDKRPYKELFHPQIFRKR